MFLFNLVVLTARALTLLIGGMYMSSLYTIMLFSVVGAVVNIIGISIVGFALKRKEVTTSWNYISNRLMEG
jgi:hypothetical protein